ncbi:MAG: Mov34/MPN/PAD-1 family protein [Candidatus Bathyarchaeia archaeon]
MDKPIVLERVVVDSVLSYAQALHPRECILLLRGKTDKHRLLITDTQLPPLATYGHSFSGFPLSMLPIDFSVIGVAHSHPSGALRPSVVDLNKFYGKLMLITAYPYLSEQNIAIFDRQGRPLPFTVV